MLQRHSDPKGTAHHPLTRKIKDLGMAFENRYTLWYTLFMSALLKIKDEDNERIEKLQKILAKESKVEVVREALMLLEEKIHREKKIEKWKKAARLAAKSSAEINKEFREGFQIKYED